MSLRISAAMATASVAFLAVGPAFGFDASTDEGAAKAINGFAFDFYLQARKGQGNFVCSPAGASIALTMLAAGAHGETQAQILRVLHIGPVKLPQDLDRVYPDSTPTIRSYTSFAQ